MKILYRYYIFTFVFRAKGIQGTRKDEKQLREIQKMQMYDKKCLEEEEMHRESMWHQVLLDEVKKKVSCIF